MRKRGVTRNDPSHDVSRAAAASTAADASEALQQRRERRSSALRPDANRMLQSDDLRDGALRDDVPARNYGDTIADLFDLGEQMRIEKDRRSPGLQLQ